MGGQETDRRTGRQTDRNRGRYTERQRVNLAFSTAFKSNKNRTLKFNPDEPDCVSPVTPAPWGLMQGQPRGSQNKICLVGRSTSTQPWEKHLWAGRGHAGSEKAHLGVTEGFPEEKLRMEVGH